MKLPRDLSGEALCRAPLRLGFSRVRQTGSHIQLRRGNQSVTVPAHGSISTGTLASILRQANIQIEELLDRL